MARDWRKAFEEARAASTAWVREDEAMRRSIEAASGPAMRHNIGFTATEDVAARIEQFIREQAVRDYVHREYAIDENGRPVREEARCRANG